MQQRECSSSEYSVLFPISLSFPLFLSASLSTPSASQQSLGLILVIPPYVFFSPLKNFCILKTSDPCAPPSNLLILPSCAWVVLFAYISNGSPSWSLEIDGVLTSPGKLLLFNQRLWQTCKAMNQYYTAKLEFQTVYYNTNKWQRCKHRVKEH